MKYNRIIICIFLVALLLTGIRGATAHPHVFIVNRVEAVFDEKGLAGIQITWSCDEFFSSMMTEDFDQNKNGSLEETEIALIKKEAFDSLAEHDYFIFVKIDGKPFKVKYVRDFSAAFHAGKLRYQFFIPCHVTALKTFKTIALSVYDPTYYSAIFFAQNRPVSLRNDAGFEVKSRIAQNMQESYYFGMVHPWELTINFRLKDG